MVRERVCADAQWLGLELDTTANDSGHSRISAESSSVSVWTIPTNEELVIARHTQRLIGASAAAA
jgi:acetate kinase